MDNTAPMAGADETRQIRFSWRITSALPYLGGDCGYGAFFWFVESVRVSA